MKILVVDDEQDVRPLFEQRFRREIKSGMHQFVFALSGKEALNILKELDTEAVVILSDINMPGMDGLELLEKIKKGGKTPTPVVIMITAYDDEENHRTASRLGANAFFTKPLDFELLKSKLTNLI